MTGVGYWWDWPSFHRAQRGLLDPGDSDRGTELDRTLERIRHPVLLNQARWRPAHINGDDALKARLRPPIHTVQVTIGRGAFGPGIGAASIRPASTVPRGASEDNQRLASASAHDSGSDSGSREFPDSALQPTPTLWR